MINLLEAAPSLVRDWIRTSTTIGSAIEPKLRELVSIRASQINGCANCINLHTSDARENGETEQRLHLLAAWEEAPCYTDKERAALAWTDALTRLSERPDHKTAHEALKGHFTEEEQVKLTLLINVINGFNRLAVGFGLFADPAKIREANRMLLADA